MSKKEPERRLTSRFFLIFAVSWISLILIGELTIFIINTTIFGGQSFAYTLPLYIMPVVALIISVIVITVMHLSYQRSEELINGLNRVAEGDYSVEITTDGGVEFKKIYDNFNKMVKELSSVQILKDDFVRNLTHELKTPIASINGFANLLLDGDLSEEERKHVLKIIADESGRLCRLSDNVLILSKLENQQLAGESEEIKLDSQIKECVILLEHDWTDKNLNIVSELSPVTVAANDALLRQLWLNLLSNAIKFTPNGGEITISLKKEGRYALVTVADNGIGIAADELSGIFEKHYRAKNSAGTDGNGLGLAICKRICTLSDGEISVESREGEGSTFTVKLPV